MLYGLITIPVVLVYAIATDGIQSGWEVDILMPIFWSGVIPLHIESLIVPITHNKLGISIP